MINADSIYKFFPYNPHDLDALSSNYLWFSEYSQFNDPFEDVYLENVLNSELGDYNEVEVIEFYKELHKGSLPDHKIEKVILEHRLNNTLETHYNTTIKQLLLFSKKKIKEHISESRVCCFSIDTESSQATKSRLMWSHYSDGLRGYCVEYSGPDLIDGIFEQTGQKVGICPMKYITLEKINFKSMIYNTAKDIHTSKDNQIQQFGSIVNTKSEEWAYENELRLLFPLQNYVPINPTAITKVIVGSKMPKTKLNTLLSILRGNEGVTCPVYQAFINHDTFEIETRLLFESI